MPDLSPGERAISSCELDDVFLVSSNCWVVRDCNPAGVIPNLTYGQETGVEGEVVSQVRTVVDSGASLHVLRYFVKVELKLLKPGVEIPAEQPSDDDLLAVLAFVVAADYRCPKELVEDRESVGAFARNVHHHCWPYLREHVHAACERMRLPRITLPMLKPTPAKSANTQKP
jgi:hypothetical protein